jgi:metal-sulfur cluster biosynthetic enzyme
VGGPARCSLPARLDEASATPQEVSSQLYGQVCQAGERRCRLVFQADIAAQGRVWYLVLYGNPYAELPSYITDLQVHGEGCGLDIENHHYLARLASHTGQLERLIYSPRRKSVVESPRNQGSSGLELHASGDGHGEAPHIDWAHDYVAADHFQKFRLTNWAECPNYEVVKVRLRRWGFPHSPAHPLFAPSRMHMDVTYTFYAGLPYFFKEARTDVLQDFVGGPRDDEWVFSGRPFTDTVWVDRDGVLHEGEVTQGHQEDLWGTGFFNRQSRDAFIALFLEHRAENFAALSHNGSPQLDYQGIPRHAQLWSRSPARDHNFSAGAVLHQRNAYLVMPYEGPALVQQTRARLLLPLAVREGVLPDREQAAASGILARQSKGKEAAPLKQKIWAALRQVRDEMFYKVDANVVDMGYIYDVQVKRNVVYVLMTMPHRGRPQYGFLAGPLRERLLELNEVSEVVVDFTWEPAWDTTRLTTKGRAAMGL